MSYIVTCCFLWYEPCHISVIIRLMGSANERRRYIVTSSLIGWAHTQKDLCICGAGGMKGVVNALTHSSMNRMPAILYTTFSMACSWMKIIAFWLKFNSSLFLRALLSKSHQVMVWCLMGIKPLPKTMLTKYLIPYGIIIPQWVKIESWVL